LVDFGAGDGVEAGGGLVVEEDSGVQGEGAGEAGAFLHAAGDLGGVLVGVLAEADEFELDLDLDVDDLAPEAGVFLKGEGDVLGDGHGVEEGAGLEEDAEAFADLVHLALADAGDVLAEEFDGAFLGLDGADHAAEEGALAAAGAAHDDHGLAGVDVEGDAVEDGAAVEALDEISDRDDGLTLLVAPAGGRRGERYDVWLRNAGSHSDEYSAGGRQGTFRVWEQGRTDGGKMERGGSVGGEGVDGRRARADE